MKKIDKIDCCGHCPLRLRKNEYYCNHPNGEFELSFLNLLPDDCPLPDDN